MGPVTASTERRLRADAQRNYDAIVAAAGQAFAESGTQASLDDIAVRAGVGNATLYRHFPTRESLMVAALRVKLAELAELADRFEASSEPAEACVSGSFIWPPTCGPGGGCPTRSRRPSAMRIRRCRPPASRCASRPMGCWPAPTSRRGRPTIEDPGDVFVIIAAISWAADVRGDSEADLRRVIDVVLTGLR